MKTRRMKPLQFFVPITRVDAEERVVEGYAFVNEVVEGEGGIRLKRSAMEAATPDYLRWGAVREMHQPVAAGTATAPGCGIEWDARGAFIRAKIVDDAAWKKVTEGVYKGFSVGVIPRLMRGKDVEQCVWAENSLVDRPKDPGTVITAFRAEAFDPDTEVEVRVVDPAGPEVPPSFAQLVLSCQSEALHSLAFDLLRGILGRLGCRGIADREQRARESIQQFAEYIIPLVRAAGEQEDAAGEPGYFFADRATVTRLLADPGHELPEPLREILAEIREHLPTPEPGPDPGTLSRLHALEAEHGTLAERAGTLQRENRALLSRASTAESELAIVRADLGAARERVTELERQPAGTPPVRFPQALSREFLANQDASRAAPLAELRAQLNRLTSELQAEPDEAKKRAGAIQVNVLRQQLAALGCSA